MKYSHTCIKCHKSYKDDDVDAYYCFTCRSEMKAVAAEFDRKREAGGPKKQAQGQIEALLSDPRTIVKNNGNSIFIRQSQL